MAAPQGAPDGPQPAVPYPTGARQGQARPAPPQPPGQPAPQYDPEGAPGHPQPVAPQVRGVVPPPLPTGQPAAPQQTQEYPPQDFSGGLHEPAEGWLTIRSIVKSFKKRTVVRGVSLDVQRGEAVGLLGPNGAGKTTTFYMITGLIPADEGSIKIDGQDVTRLPMYRRARLGIGYLPQEASIFRGLTVEDNILAVLETVESNKKARHEQLDALLEEFRITRLRKSPAMRLSGGERRRVEIARALATRPSYMLLDEPFAGIDPIAV
ncbi:MAG: LPS export ABC transporter ATP-binding protein, partial [Pseudomonadota bacterium]